MRRLLVAFAVFAAFPLGCSSANDKDSLPLPDASRKDARTETTSDDGSVSDTKTPTGDTSVGDSGGKTCNAHAGDECDMVKQDCADPTATCTYDGTTKHNVCAKVATGTKLKGEACASPAECDRGLFCYSGKCSPACCSGDDSVCGAGGSCKLAITDDGGAVIHYACSYSPPCKPFKYDCPSGMVCLFNDEPDVFKCSLPSSSTTGVGVAPGTACKYVNDCGESQSCFTITTPGSDSGGSTNKCYLFCWLMTPSGFTPGTMPDGRFPANGTCTVGGTNYGTCSAVTGIGGGLGICVK
jgi:hypothetical protein